VQIGLRIPLQDTPSLAITAALRDVNKSKKLASETATDCRLVPFLNV